MQYWQTARNGIAALLVAGMAVGCVHGGAARPTLDALADDDGPQAFSYDNVDDNDADETNADPPRPEQALEERAEILTVPGVPDEPAPLTRDGALLTALSNNRNLEIARFGPRVAAAFESEARAAFDPDLMATLSYGRSRSQLGGAQRFTFGRAGGGSGQSMSFEGQEPEEILRQIGGAAIEVLQQPQQDDFLETRNSDGEVRVSNYFPTGTTVFLTGGMSRSIGNFTAEEFEGTWTVGVTQALLEGFGPNVNLVNLRQARNRRAQSRLIFREAVLGLTAQVERAYWDLVLARELLTIREFGVELADEQVRRNMDLVEVGLAIESAVLSARAERSTREAELSDARADLEAQTLFLLQLLNPDERETWNIELLPVDPPEVTEIEVDPEESEALAHALRPELEADRLELANRDLDLVSARNSLLPRLDLTARYGRTSLGDSFAGGRRYLDSSRYDNYRVGLEFSMPIVNRAERAQRLRAQYERDSARVAVAERREDLAREVRQAAVEVRNQWFRIQATEDAVAGREEELRVEEDRYSVGRSTNLDVLQVQRLLIEARVDAVQARVNYLKALTDLYAAEGALLARRGISLEAGY